jgi:putative chitinase
MITADLLHRLWPKAPHSLVDGIAGTAPTVLPKHEIASPLRLAHFFAQISHESGGGTITEESLYYTHAQRIVDVWPSRFTIESAKRYIRDPRKLADRVYNGRMGNAPGSDDGYNFRGRGLLQITGRDSYREIGGLCGFDLENHPDLAYAPDHALEVAATEFVHLGCLPFCDEDDVMRVTKLVNGGYTGIDSRRAWLKRWKAAL